MANVELKAVFTALSCGGDVITLDTISRALGPALNSMLELDFGLSQGQSITWQQFLSHIGKHTDTKTRTAGHSAFLTLVGKGADPQVPLLGSDRLYEVLSGIESFASDFLPVVSFEDSKTILRRTTGGAPMNEETFNSSVHLTFPTSDSQQQQ